MKYAVRSLARGWRRGAAKWYIGTSAVLGLSITLLLLISGLFAGMQAETQQRVADFYTDDVRITPAGLSAIPSRDFFDLNATLDTVRGHEDTNGVAVHYESQGILSRRGFLDAALTEDDQFQVGAGGREGDGDEIIALGALIGREAGGADTPDLMRHIVSGGLPAKGDGKGSIPLVMSLDRLDQFLTAEERADLPWPPPISGVKSLSFEITAAVVVGEGETRDVIRRPAHIVGLYDSGVDVLDSFTFIAPIEDVRQLNDIAPNAPAANVLLVDSDDRAATAQMAARNGWTAQDSVAFTDRYLGQLIDVLQVLSTLVSIFLFMLPAFLIMHGVGRQLETHNREIAVCHAIGVRRRAVRQALGSVVAQVTLVAIGLATFLTLVIGFTLHLALPGRRDLPLPMDFTTTPLAVGLALGVTILSVLAALWLAFRSQARQDLSSTLRTF